MKFIFTILILLGVASTFGQNRCNSLPVGNFDQDLNNTTSLSAKENGGYIIFGKTPGFQHISPSGNTSLQNKAVSNGNESTEDFYSGAANLPGLSRKACSNQPNETGDQHSDYFNQPSNGFQHLNPSQLIK
jgi:hypothetical protein